MSGSSTQSNDPTFQPTDDYTSDGGATTISPDVILTIIRLTTIAVEGVSRMAPVPKSVKRFLHRRDNQGVVMEVRNDCVYADIYIAARPNLNLRELSRAVQRSVSRSISEMVGMQVGRVNVHIEDIDFPSES